jgi:hypothetical protein
MSHAAHGGNVFCRLLEQGESLLGRMVCQYPRAGPVSSEKHELAAQAEADEQAVTQRVWCPSR